MMSEQIRSLDKMSEQIRSLDAERERLGRIIIGNPGTLLAKQCTANQSLINTLLTDSIKLKREKEGLPELPSTVISFKPADVHAIRT